MATIQRTETRCDLCGYGGPYSDERGFERHGGFDFCRWCSGPPIRKTECGGHTVTVTGDTWVCGCGVTMAMLKLTLWRYGVGHAAMDAVPNLASATAAIHVQTPNWPHAW